MKKCSGGTRGQDSGQRDAQAVLQDLVMAWVTHGYKYSIEDLLCAQAIKGNRGVVGAPTRGISNRESPVHRVASNN